MIENFWEQDHGGRRYHGKTTNQWPMNNLLLCSEKDENFLFLLENTCYLVLGLCCHKNKMFWLITIRSMRQGWKLHVGNNVDSEQRPCCWKKSSIL